MKDLPLMSTKEARKILGVEAKGMSDEQILEVILLLTDAAKEFLMPSKTNKVKQK